MAPNFFKKSKPATSPEQDDAIRPAGPRHVSSSASSPYNIHSSAASSSALAGLAQRRYFQSRKVRKEDIQRPWLAEKDPKKKWQWIFPLIGIILGIGLTVFLCVEGYTSVPQHKYCSVLDEDFSSGLNTDIWSKEVQVGGFGNGQFEETTATDENAFIQDGNLWIKPTLQDPKLMTTNNTINLLHNGCTGTTFSECVTTTNTTNGTIVQPVRSARLNTKKGAHIKYGRVEVVAQFPSGDWLWPAIWMLPTNNTYGVWPESGEIDIAEARGNNRSYAGGGNEIVYSTLHWGPNSDYDGDKITTGGLVPEHSTLPAKFHTFGLEWSEKYVFMYMDSRLLQVLYIKFDEPFWQRGNIPVANDNGTQFINPWADGTDSTPFDQDFYLIINVAVGGTNGWFPDGKGGKPWVDGSSAAKLEFWEARDQWYPTWEEGGQMIVKSVKMWQQAGYNGCS